MLPPLVVPSLSGRGRRGCRRLLSPSLQGGVGEGAAACCPLPSGRGRGGCRRLLSPPFREGQGRVPPLVVPSLQGGAGEGAAACCPLPSGRGRGGCRRQVLSTSRHPAVTTSSEDRGVTEAAQMDSDRHRVRQPRNQMTDAEVCLWWRLRGWQMDGYRFRRQVPKGPYILDFVCLKARLVIEVDGGQHAAAFEADNQRTAWLQSQGFRVLRFWNNDALHRTNRVLETIRAALPAPLTRLPRKAKRGLRQKTGGDWFGVTRTPPLPLPRGEGT